MATTATETNKDLALVNNGIQLFQTVPGILTANKTSLDRAKLAADNLLKKAESNGGQLNEDLDKEAEQLIVKIKATAGKMNDNRKPFTQIMDEVKKMFTSLEKDANDLIGKIQPLRDGWAKYVIEEAEKKRKEAERRAAIQTEETNFKFELTKKINTHLNSALFDKKDTWTKSFNTITLENFSEKEMKLKAISTEMVMNKVLDTFPKEGFTDSLYVTAERKQELFNEVFFKEYDYDTFIKYAQSELMELKQDLIDKLPSKKAELEAERKAELERQAALEKAEKEAAERRAAMEKANAEEKIRLEKEAAIAKEAEEKRLADLKEEQDRIAQEKAKREKEEQERLAQERAEAERKSKEQAELQQASQQAATLFEQVIDSTPESQAPESRQSFDIKVKHPAGWVEIFQFWYQREGVSMPVDEMGKKSLNQMKSFVEKVAKDQGEKIESKFLSYEIEVKAVNRKAK